MKWLFNTNIHGIIYHWNFYLPTVGLCFNVMNFGIWYAGTKTNRILITFSTRRFPNNHVTMDTWQKWIHGRFPSMHTAWSHLIHTIRSLTHQSCQHGWSLHILLGSICCNRYTSATVHGFYDTYMKRSSLLFIIFPLLLFHQITLSRYHSQNFETTEAKHSN